MAPGERKYWFQLPAKLRKQLAISRAPSSPSTTEVKVTIPEARSKLCDVLKKLLQNIESTIESILDSKTWLIDSDITLFDELLLRLKFWEESAGLSDKPPERPLLLPLLDTILYHESRESLSKLLRCVRSISRSNKLSRKFNSTAPGLTETEKIQLTDPLRYLNSVRLRGLLELQRMVATLYSEGDPINQQLSLLAFEKANYVGRNLPTKWHRLTEWSSYNRQGTESVLGRLVSDAQAPLTSLYPLATAEAMTYTGNTVVEQDFSTTDFDIILIVQRMFSETDQLIPLRLLMEDIWTDYYANFPPKVRFARTEMDPNAKQLLEQERCQTLIQQYDLKDYKSAYAITGLYTLMVDFTLFGSMEFLLGVETIAARNIDIPEVRVQERSVATDAASTTFSQGPGSLIDSSFRGPDSIESTMLTSFSGSAQASSNPVHIDRRKPLDLFAFDQLRYGLQQELDQHRIGLENEHNYLPEEVVSLFTSPKAVKQLFPSLSNEVCRFITASAPKTYLILVLSLQTDSMVLEALESFQKHKFSDKDLPITKLTQRGAQSKCVRDWGTPRAAYVENCDVCADIDPKKYSCDHPPPYFAFHHACWDRFTFDLFFDKQWIFLVQKFDSGIFMYPEVESNRFLPLRRPETIGKIGAGYFSDVQKVDIVKEFLDPGSAKDISRGDEGTVPAALKTLKHVAEEHYRVELEWKREAEAYLAMNELRHPHIVRGIAAFSHRGRYHLLLEWASQSSLEKIWFQNPRPNLNRRALLAWLQQLLGLADALFCMHTGGKTVTVPSKQLLGDEKNAEATSRLSENIPQIVVSTEEAQGAPARFMTEIKPPTKQNWRHGDINPGNIISFTIDNEGPGTLKLGDFGRAKRHRAVTRFRPTVERDLWHTVKYEPPDLFVTGYQGVTSRLYDVWSLGCVFFETIIWMLYGLGEIHNLTETSMSRSEESPYWSRQGQRHAKLSDMVTLWMDFMLNNEPRCAVGSSALGDLLNVVREKMLVVNLPDDSDLIQAGRRAPASVIVQDLTNILHQASKDPAYLDTCLHQGKGVTLPPAFLASRKSVSTKRDPDETASRLAVVSKGTTPPASTRTNPQVRLYQYQDTSLFDWGVEDDSSFIRHAMSNLKLKMTLDFEPEVSGLCTTCALLDIPGLLSRPVWLLSEYVENTGRQDCALCTMIYNVARRAGVAPQDPVELKINQNRLVINGKSNACMRLCKPISESHLTQERDAVAKTERLSYAHVQHGMPRLVTTPNLYLVQEWLAECDLGHDCVDPRGQVFLPLRLLEVSTLRLRDTKGWKPQVEYAALSHIWGSNRVLRTTSENLQSHYSGIFPADLHTVYRDAILIAKSLGIEYLWIDALCIVQDNKNEVREFLQNATRIYNCAYVTLAASSQQNVDASMLNSRYPARYASLPVSKERQGEALMISDLTDDFDHDVLDSALNRRAWNLEARAFSRRTVYFTDKQLYWECGIGIRCETLSKVTNVDASFLGDPKFPTRFLSKDTEPAICYSLISRLYELYSVLETSHPVNRTLAIANFERRLSDVLGWKHAAGVFETLKHQWLLWERAPDVSSLLQINFGAAETREPPSWSWQAYTGGIAYLQPPSGKIQWHEIELVLPGGREKPWFDADDNPRLVANVVEFDRQSMHHSDCAITYDISGKVSPYGFGSCVILGTLGDDASRVARHYVIVLEEVRGEAEKWPEYKTAFRRIGVGYLSQRVILTGRPSRRGIIM